MASLSRDKLNRIGTKSPFGARSIDHATRARTNKPAPLPSVLPPPNKNQRAPSCPHRHIRRRKPLRAHRLEKYLRHGLIGRAGILQRRKIDFAKSPIQSKKALAIARRKLKV